MHEWMKILIVEVSKRKCFTGAFKAKPLATIVPTNILIWLHLGCIHELQKLHNIADSLSLSIVLSNSPHK